MKKMRALFVLCLLLFLFKVQIVSAQTPSCKGDPPKFVMANTIDLISPPSAVKIIDHSKTVRSN